jgi:hypothetical protein
MPTRESTKAYYEKYHASEKAKKQRAMRNSARREFEREGLVHKGDGKDVDHKRALVNGGSNDRSNLRAVSVHTNRGYKRDAKNRPI